MDIYASDSHLGLIIFWGCEHAGGMKEAEKPRSRAKETSDMCILCVYWCHLDGGTHEDIKEAKTADKGSSM